MVCLGRKATRNLAELRSDTSYQNISTEWDPGVRSREIGYAAITHGDTFDEFGQAVHTFATLGIEEPNIMP
jgi:hypothetical protein